MSALGDRRLATRAGLSLVLASVRYRLTVAPVVRAELAHWRRRAGAIEDDELRALALGKLRAEAFNAEAGAMLATLAPRARRAEAVRAIVALEVLFDLLDGLTERPLADPMADGERLYGAFTSALESPAADAGGASEDGGYMRELSLAAGEAFAGLPAAGAVSRAALASARRAAEAQIRIHAAPRLGTGQLREWAEGEAGSMGLGWRELLAGAGSSVLVVHALIAAGAHAATTPSEAAEIERAYLSICVLVTLLDSLIDGDREARPGELAYAALYEEEGTLAAVLGESARRALGEVRELPGAPAHLVMLTGAVAYYASAPGGRAELARPALSELERTLAPMASATLILLRAWRMGRR